MCLGGDTTDTKTTTSTPDPAVKAAATGNIDFVQNLQNQGFTPYGGQQVANFSPQQQQSFNMVGDIAGNNTAQTAGALINNYANAGPQSVQANSIASNMPQYMNQYVMQALAPQMQQMNMQNAAQNAQTNAQATGSGAFGDARTGIEQANNQFNQGVQREGVIGNAYNNAFNTAISAGAQDSSNQLQAGTTNANLQETALNRQLAGATAQEGLQNQQLGVAGQLNTAGQQQTAQQQAQLNAQYQQWMMAQQYPFQTAQLMNQTTATAAGAMPATQVSTEVKPDNSGMALLGGLGGALLGNSGFGSALGSAMFLSDVRVKKNVSRVGKLTDNTPVYSFRYIDDPENVTRVGLMAQDVEKRRPDAVTELWPGGIKAVDYDKATELSRLLARAI